MTGEPKKQLAESINALTEATRRSGEQMGLQDV